jgi:hypothetical protein
LAVLEGDKTKAGGKVINPTKDDTVFIFFSGHGTPGVMSFPGVEFFFFIMNELLGK